jgi:hypothetical protein
MPATEHAVENESAPLDDIILYLLSKSSRDVLESGYKVPISDVHNLFEPIEEELREEFNIPVKFHKSSEEVHSRQIERALNDIIPYKIPVRNPSFSLEITRDISDMALERVSDELTEQQKNSLDKLSEEPKFQEKLRDHSEKLKG